MFRSLITLAAVFAAFSQMAAAQAPPVGFDLTNYGVRIEPDKRVMTVLAALDAARTTNANGESVPVLNVALSKEGEKFRELLRSDLAKLDPKLRERISYFVLRHKRANPKKSDAEITAAFISMAYALTPAPELADPVVTGDLPGGLLDVLDFAPLVRDFYRSSSFAGNLPEYVKNYQAVAGGAMRKTTGDMVLDLLNYLQTRPQIYYSERTRTETARSGSKTTKIATTETVEKERKFFLVPEMLAPSGNVIFTNIKDEYFVVLPPDSDVTISEARRAFLQFVIDPLVLGSSKDVAVIRENLKKVLDEMRKENPAVSPDVFLTISRSLVASIDAKQVENFRVKVATRELRRRVDAAPTNEEKRAIASELEKFKAEQADEAILRLSEDHEKGAVLVFYFADQLKGIEDSGFNIASSMREMILSMEPAKEADRYRQYGEARDRAKAARAARRAAPGESTIFVENPVTTRLIEIDRDIAAKKYAEARASLLELLDKSPADARIYYTIGRVSSLIAAGYTKPEDEPKQRQALVEAKVAYENVLRTAAAQRTDAALISLSYVELGKIFEFFGDSTYAIGIYDAAIRVGDVSGGAYSEAIAAKARLIKDNQ